MPDPRESRPILEAHSKRRGTHTLFERSGDRDGHSLRLQQPSAERLNLRRCHFLKVGGARIQGDLPKIPRLSASRFQGALESLSAEIRVAQQVGQVARCHQVTAGRSRQSKDEGVPRQSN
jgi:hypothetical protein